MKLQPLAQDSVRRQMRAFQDVRWAHEKEIKDFFANPPRTYMDIEVIVTYAGNGKMAFHFVNKNESVEVSLDCEAPENAYALLMDIPK